GEVAARLTATGVAMGTPAYMSPEQVMGSRTVDARTDVWAFGVMMHELLSGALPFNAEVASELFVRIATTDPTPLADAAPGVSEEMANIVAKCLARDRTARYADASELAADLRAVRPRGRDDGSVGRVPAAPPAVS